MALILTSHQNPLPIDENYSDDLLGVLPEYRSAKSLSEKLIDFDAVKVERSGNNIELTFNYPQLKTKKYTISPSIFKEKGRFDIFVTKTGDFYLADVTEILRHHNWDRLRTLKSLMNGYGPVAKIYFDNSFTDGIVYLLGLPISNESFEIVNSNTLFIEYVISKFPSAQALRTADAAKSKVLHDLNYIDSIVALEQQVDLLTTLVKNLINNTSQPSWSSDFLTKSEASSVTTLQSADEVITALDTAKKKIRAAQKTYFDTK